MSPWGGAAVSAKETDLGDLNVYKDDASWAVGTGTTNDTVTPDQKVYVSLDELGTKLGTTANVPGDVLNDSDFSSLSTRRALITAK